MYRSSGNPRPLRLDSPVAADPVSKDFTSKDSASKNVSNTTSSAAALDASVLVLNRSYMAVHVVGVRRAFGLLLAELAEVIDNEDGYFANYDFQGWMLLSEMRAIQKKPLDDWIRAVNFELQVPRVVRLLSFDRVPRAAIYPSRQAIFARDSHRCQYCGQRFPVSKLSLDHVVPRRSGGENTWENMVCACRKCNVKKGGRTPREARMKLAQKPVRPTTSPLLLVKLDNPKYNSWAMWLGKTVAPITEPGPIAEDDSAATLRSA